jgi:transketolase
MTQGWCKYVGLDGDVLGIDHYGASAPGGTVFKQFGFTVENVVSRALALLKH